MAKGKDLISCRTVLWYMVFSGCAINYMFKINLNLVLVAIVLPKKARGSVGQCVVESDETIGSNVTFVPQSVGSTTPRDGLEYEGRFDWNEYEQGLIIGAFFWLYWASQVPGGVLGRRYGAKIIFGGANLISGIICLLLPFVMKLHIVALIVLRCIQGLVMGVMYPALHGLPVKWVPSSERSKFVTANLGGSVGTAITYPLCATIIYYFNWEAAFYVSSLLGFIWFGLWCYLVYDSPHEHPRISVDELEYIAKNTPPPIAHERKNPVPWWSILTSGPLWVTIAAQWGITWGFFTLLAQAPSYFNYIHGWSLNMTGVLSGAPHLALMAFAYLVATLGDYLLRTKKMSLNAVRKIATIIATGGQAVMLIGLSLSGCRPSLAVTFMILGTATNGAISTGPISNIVDLSPNYAGVLLGITNLVSMATAFLSPMIVGLLTNNNQTVEQWRLVFLIAAANLMAGCIVYVLFGTSEEQPWNHQPLGDGELGEELEKLKPNSTNTELVQSEKETSEKNSRGNVTKE